MAFPNFTGLAEYKKSIPRVFVRTKFSDLECDLIKTSSAIPTSGDWVQIYTGDGGIVLTPTRTTTKLGDQQTGSSRVIQDDMECTMEINIAQVSLEVLQDLCLMDPSSSTSADVLDLKANRGLDITDSAISLLVYDKNYDPSNETNIPDIDADPMAIVIFKACPMDAAPVVYNAQQGTYKLTFECLVSKSAGSSNGIMGRIGAFTAATA